MNIPQEIQDKLEDYLDQSLSQQDFEVVVSWAKQSDANAKELVDWFLWHAQLRDVAQIEDLRQLFESQSHAGSHLPDSTPQQAISEQAEPFDRHNSPRRSSRTAWVLAASLIIGSGLLMWLYYSPQGDSEKALDSFAAKINGMEESSDFAEDTLLVPSLEGAVAYLGRCSECEWTSPNWGEGDPVRADTEVSLEKGVAELIFDSGARVSLRGPCQLLVTGPESFALEVGDVSVEASLGFKVTTPSGVVLDLGTAFGVSVNKAGDAEVHVFEGEVVFKALDSSGNKQQDSILLKKEQACRYSVGGISLDEFQANESMFAWRQRGVISDEDAPDLPVREGLALWLAADRFVETDDLGRVVCWRDILVSTNRTAEDALQPIAKYRPVLVEDGINGEPAVVFGGVGTFLLTPPLHTTNEQTAFVVCSLNRDYPQFQPILNYNGPPQRIPDADGGPVTPGVFQIFLNSGGGNGRFGIKGHVFRGFASGRKRKKRLGETVSVNNRLSVGQSAVIAFQHAPEKRQLSLYVNSGQVGALTADLDIALTSRKIIGRHPVLEERSLILRGGLGEIIVFNRALPAEEITEVSDYLRQRFGI